MTELENLKSENESLRKEINRVKRESTQYLQNLAHQLTAPLGAIKWSIEGLTTAANVSIERRKKLLSSVYSQATILVHLIKNFTLMSNLETDSELGQFREQPKPVDLLRLAINLANDFQPQAFDTQKKIVVDDASFRAVFGTYKVSVEKTLVSQAISNILENAVKYANPRTTIEIIAVNGDGIGIKITSHGIQISEEDKRRLFERNFRGTSACQKVPAGTGIGLYLVRHIMRLHKGRVEVETEGNKSSFILLFRKESIS